MRLNKINFEVFDPPCPDSVQMPVLLKKRLEPQGIHPKIADIGAIHAIILGDDDVDVVALRREFSG